MSSPSGLVAGLPMYDWPEVRAEVDHLWATIAAAGVEHGVVLPDRLTRTELLVDLWGDPSMILGQVCSLNPVRDGLGETEVIGTIAYEPSSDLPDSEPGTYYSVLVARADDDRVDGLDADGVGTVAANETIRRFTHRRPLVAPRDRARTGQHSTEGDRYDRAHTRRRVCRVLGDQGTPRRTGRHAARGRRFAGGNRNR